MADAAAWYANDVAVVAAAISGVALGVSGLSVWYIRRQTRASERQASAAEDTVRLQAQVLRSQALDTAAALDIARRNAIAAEDSASSTKALTRLGQRAWLVLEPPEVSDVQSSDEYSLTITIRSTLRNSGLTPAFAVRAHSQFGQWALPVTQWPLGEPAAATTILGPNISLNVAPTPILVSDEHLREVRAGRRVLLFFGDCLYKDVFDEAQRTRWCLQCSFDCRTLESFNSEFQIMS